MNVFISYSHKDEWAVERLRTHSSMLKRAGTIFTWYDRDLTGGDNLDSEIGDRLNTSELFVAMVSPDFINSDYCYSTEMMRALERHSVGEMVVLPVIVEHCDWKETPLKNLLAVPTDGTPISSFENTNEAFLQVTKEIRKIAGKLVPQVHLKDPKQNLGAKRRFNTTVLSRDQYFVEKDFDEFDKKEYRDQAFQSIQKFFEAAVGEIVHIDGIRARIDLFENSAFTATISNSFVKETAHITVRSSTGSFGGDISFAHGERVGPGTSNGMFSVESDGFELGLTAFMFGLFGSDKGALISPETAAGMIWSELLKSSRISDV